MTYSSAFASRRPSLVRAELTKLVTLRSIWVTWLVTFVTVIVFGWSQAAPVGEALRDNDPDLAPGATPETVGFEWVALGMIGVIVIGVFAASSEYISGQIKTTLVAAPERRKLFAAKIVALTAVVTALGLATVPLLSLLAQHSIGELSVVDGGIPGSLVRRWFGAIVYWDAIALISFSFALLLRQALVPLFVVIVVSQLSLMLLLLSTNFTYLPTIAGVQLFDPGLVVGSYPDAELATGTAALVTITWTIAALGVAGWRMNRRDTYG